MNDSKSPIQLLPGVRYLWITSSSGTCSNYSYSTVLKLNSKFPLLKSIFQYSPNACLCLSHYFTSWLNAKHPCLYLLDLYVYSTPQHWENKWMFESSSRNNLILKPQVHHGHSFSTLLLIHWFFWVCFYFLIMVLLSPGQGIY